MIRFVMVACAAVWLLVPQPAGAQLKPTRSTVAPATTPVAASAENIFHLPGQGQPFSSPRQMQDGGGFLWDILFNGAVASGTESCYDSGMLIFVDGTRLDEGTSSAAVVISSDGREIELGPWTRNDLRVWRRAAVPNGKTYARWIDLYQNTSETEIRRVIRYSIDTRSENRVLETTSGGEAVTAKDSGLLTANATNMSRPTLCHFFGVPGARVRPAVTASKTTRLVEYEFRLAIPAGKTVGICLFESQQKTLAEAKKLLATFDPAAEIASLPAPLREILVNLSPSGASMDVGGLVLPRRTDADIVLLRNNTERRGELSAVALSVVTPYGKCDLAASRIVGLVADETSATRVRVALTDGQVVAGELASPLPSLLFAEGNSVSLPLDAVRSLAYRVSPERPEKIVVGRPMVVTRMGSRLAFDPATADLTFRTQQGAMKLAPQSLAGLLLDTPGGGLHRAVFRDGSVLSGLLENESLSLNLEMGLKSPARLNSVSQFIFYPPQPAPVGAAVLRLANDDVLYGRLTGELKLLVRGTQEITVPPAFVADVTAIEGTVDIVQIKLRDGVAFTGSLIGRAVPFTTLDGAELKVFAAHVASLTVPKPEAVAAATSTSAPAAEGPRMKEADVLWKYARGHWVRVGPDGGAVSMPIVAPAAPATKPSEAPTPAGGGDEVDVLKKKLAEISAMRASLEANAESDERKEEFRKAKLAELRKMEKELMAKINAGGN